MMSSFARSTMVVKPSASTVTMSPVRSHPPGRSVVAVSSGLFQYPEKTCGPFSSSSPGSPCGTSTVRSCWSTTFMSVDGNGTPIVPVRRVGWNGLPRATGDDSVMP
jgi:hypothetical protein